MPPVATTWHKQEREGKENWKQDSELQFQLLKLHEHLVPTLALLEVKEKGRGKEKGC